jgi:hypothetical protein
MAARLARSRLLHCDPDHIAALCGRSAAGRFTFVEVFVIMVNALRRERRIWITNSSARFSRRYEGRQAAPRA